VDREGRQVEVAIGQLPGCEADPALLKQVFVNLLSNALKYTKPRNPARIEVGALMHGEAESVLADATVYYVRDNGVGFDMRYVEKLFGVFQRLHKAEEFEGTGVGLAIVHRIVSRHGGRIWADATVDRGATFYFTLAGADATPHPEPKSTPMTA
jgi:light-regulated signal transduction histidine kinase (bacteriophytochrome)